MSTSTALLPPQLGAPMGSGKAASVVASISQKSAPALAQAAPAATEISPPPRELGVANTVEILRRLRRDRGLFQELCISELEELAELCSPFGFKRSEVLFARGEPASWFGILLAGRASASIPHGGAGGGELSLGDHSAGEMLGITRVPMWEKSHARAYTLRAIEDGCIAVISYDQLENLRRAQPLLHHALLRVFLSHLADACGSFFRGCPVSCALRWPLSGLTERRLLDFFVRLRDEGRLFTGVDYHSLLALACRLRVTEWQARTSVFSRGEPLPGALLVLDGKLTGFRDAGGAPSVWFGPGDCIGLESVLGSLRPCPIDIFAARPTLAALLLPSDLEDLRREYPLLATQVLLGLYAKLCAELAGPHPHSLMLLAEGAERVYYAPGTSPALAPGPLRFPGHMQGDEIEAATRLAETTAPIPRFLHPMALGFDVMASREDAALRRLLSDPNGLTASWADEAPKKAEWLLGSFLVHKLAESQSTGAAGRTAMREAALAALAAEGGARSSSPPRSPGVNPLSASGGFEGFGAASELRLGLVSPARGRRNGPSSRSRDSSPSRPHWRAPLGAGRPRSAPPGGAAIPKWPSDLLGSKSSSVDLLSHVPPSIVCPSCGSRVQLSGKQVAHAEAPPGREAKDRAGFDPEPRKVARVVSSAYRHGNRADFYVGGKKIPLDSGRWQLHEGSRRGINIVTLDPDSQLVVTAWAYDTTSNGQAASAQMAADLNALPEGRIVLIAVRGSGLEGLHAGALRALQRVGATAAISNGSPQEGYALIGMKGGTAVAERRGFMVDIEAELPKPPWQEPQDLSWYFQQQKQFLSDLKVAEDRHEAWNSKVIAQEEEIEALKAKVKELTLEKDGLRKDLQDTMRERDEWQVAALRSMSQREFRSSVEAMEAAKRRPLLP